MIKKIKLSMFYFYITLISLILFIFLFMQGYQIVRMYRSTCCTAVLSQCRLSCRVYFGLKALLILFFIFCYLFCLSDAFWIRKRQLTRRPVRSLRCLLRGNLPVLVFTGQCVCISRRNKWFDLIWFYKPLYFPNIHLLFTWIKCTK